MIEKTKEQTSIDLDREIELSSFAENIARLTSVLLIIERELNSEGTDVNRVGVYLSELNSLKSELKNQSERAVRIGGENNPLYQAMRGALEKSESIAQMMDSKALDAQKQLDALTQTYQKNMEELDNPPVTSIQQTFKTNEELKSEWLSESTEALSALARSISPLLDSQPSVRDQLIGPLGTAVNLAIRGSILQYQLSSGDPPRGPIDIESFKEDDENMESRVAKLETSVEYIQRDIAEIKTDIREMRKDARTDFRLLFGAIVTLGGILGSLMAKGFHWF